MLTPERIQEIYDTFVGINDTDEYKHRYDPLPLEKNNKKWKWEGKDLPRVISLLEFERYVQKYNFEIEKLLTINGANDPEYEFLKGRVKSHLDVDYDKDPQKYDLHNLQLNHNNFDFCYLNQTFEHTYDPYTCLKNIYNYLKPGAWFYTNVPACNPPHSTPYHYFMGYTPMGLPVICEDIGFEIKEVGQWGNEEYMVKLWTRNPGWSDYTQISRPGLNEFHNPVITWVLVQKPL